MNFDLSTADPIETLGLHAAAFSLGLLWSEDLPLAADRALSQGLYSESLAELANTTAPIMSEAGPLFSRAMGELGIGTGSREASARRLARHCIRQALTDSCSPRDALGLLNDVVNAAQDVLPDSKYVGSALDVGRLCSLFWSYGEPNENCFEGRIIHDESERQAILDRLVREESRAWLQRNPAPDPCQ